MEKLLRLSFAVLFIILNSLFIIPNVHAQSVNIEGPRETPASVPGILVPNPAMGDRTIYPGNEQVNVSARVGEYIINLSGLAAPNASVILEDENGTFLRSTVANSQGYFYFTDLAVRENTGGFCFENIDFERLGVSNTCLTTGAIQQDGDIDNIYLPPTIGLFAKQINAGSEALIYGYSMPNAAVTVRIQNGLTFELTANEGGYYEYRYDEVPAGKYFLNATGVFENLSSLEPIDGVELEALSLPEQVITTVDRTIDDTGELLTTTNFGFLILIILLLLIIFIIALFLLKPALARALFDKLKKRNALHHDWLLEFIEENSV